MEDASAVKWVETDVLRSVVVARLDSRVLVETISVFVDGAGVVSPISVELVTLVAPVLSGSVAAVVELGKLV